MMATLVEELRQQAETMSNIHRQMAEAKSVRQTDNPEGRTDLYSWPRPEELLGWKAAERIEALEARLRANTDQFAYYAQQHRDKIAAFEKSKSKELPAATSIWDQRIADTIVKAKANEAIVDANQQTLAGVKL